MLPGRLRQRENRERLAGPTGFSAASLSKSNGVRSSSFSSPEVKSGPDALKCVPLKAALALVAPNANRRVAAAPMAANFPAMLIFIGFLFTCGDVSAACRVEQTDGECPRVKGKLGRWNITPQPFRRQYSGVAA